MTQFQAETKPGPGSNFVLLTCGYTMTIKTLRPLTSGYGAWRRFCGLSVPNDTSELAEILRNSTLADKLQVLYGTPHNIDVWVGAISEPPLPGGRVGPLLSCLLARQFRALRDGDRYKN